MINGQGSSVVILVDISYVAARYSLACAMSNTPREERRVPGCVFSAYRPLGTRSLGKRAVDSREAWFTFVLNRKLFWLTSAAVPAATDQSRINGVRGTQYYAAMTRWYLIVSSTCTAFQDVAAEQPFRATFAIAAASLVASVGKGRTIAVVGRVFLLQAG